MNETIKVLNNRFSVRKFKDQDIPDDVLNTIINSGLKSASAGNLQPFSIIKIKSEENKKFFTNLGVQKFVEQAPVSLLFCLDFNRLKRWAEHHKAPFVMEKSFNHFWVGFQDVIILAQTIETAANSLGIGSCYVGTTIQIIDSIVEHFKLPKGVLPVVLLPMGYPDQEQRIAPKLDIDTIVHDEQYQEMDINELTNKYLDKYGEPKQKLSEDKLNKILQVVEEVEGMEQRKVVEEFLFDQDKISRPMHYFALHYVANHMARYNSNMMDYFTELGFIWASKQNHPKQ